MGNAQATQASRITESSPQVQETDYRDFIQTGIRWVGKRRCQPFLAGSTGGVASVAVGSGSGLSDSVCR